MSKSERQLKAEFLVAHVVSTVANSLATVQHQHGEHLTNEAREVLRKLVSKAETATRDIRKSIEN